MFFNGLYRHRAALCLADHAGEPRFLKDVIGKFVHSRGCRGACRAHRLVSHRVNGAHVIDKFTRQIDRQRFALLKHLGHALMRRIPPCEHSARQQ